RGKSRAAAALAGNDAACLLNLKERAILTAPFLFSARGPASLIHKCAIDGCTRDFKYFREGKLFEFPSGPVGAGRGTKNLHRRMLWICDDCSRRFTLDYRDGEIVAVDVQARRVA